MRRTVPQIIQATLVLFYTVGLHSQRAMLLLQSTATNQTVVIVAQDSFQAVRFDSNEAWGIIHLGKCGGLSLKETLVKNQHLRIGQLSQRGVWYHVNTPNLTRHHEWLVLLRNPVDRIKSWFMYDHRSNFPWRTDQHLWPIQNEKVRQFFQCYPTLDKLCRDGLEEYKAKDKASECQQLAHMAIPCNGSGQMTGFPHLYWNFHRYFHNLLFLLLQKNHSVFVVRADFMRDDLNGINRQLGDTGMISEVLHVSHWKNTSYPMKDRSLSAEGLVNLCAQLCEEIQLFKLLVRQAHNLDELAYQQSMQKLPCPLQVQRGTCVARVDDEQAYQKHIEKLRREEINQLRRDKDNLPWAARIGRLIAQRLNTSNNTVPSNH